MSDSYSDLRTDIYAENPDLEKIHARAWRWITAKGGSHLTPTEIENALKAGEGALRSERAVAKQ